MKKLNTETQLTFFKTYLGIVFLIFFTSIHGSIFGQDQKMSDSLAVIYREGHYEPDEELELLKTLAKSETNTDKILEYGKLLTNKAKAIDSTDYEFYGYLRQGDAYRLKSELTRALELYLDAAKIASTNNLKSREASINIAIADVYSIMEDGTTAVNYYRKALALLDHEEDELVLASAQLNLGDEYFNQNKLDSALLYFSKSSKVFNQKGYEIGVAYNLGNIGLVYAKMGNPLQAEENLNSAIKTLEKLEDYYPICVYLIAMADLYDAKGEKEKALNYASKSLDLAKKHGLKEQISDSYLKLSDLSENNDEIRESLNYYKEHITFRDQVSSIKEVQKMANIRTEYEVSQKQIEVDLLNQQQKVERYIGIGIGTALVLIGLLAISLFRSNNIMKKSNKIIAVEKQRSDDLLKNILPAGTVKELKENGSVKAKRFEQVSVLFTDFKGFTKSAERLEPEMLVKSVNFYFSKFDEIIEKHGLEKIKTIGDAYMCASGLPTPTNDHASKICYAAMDIIEFTKQTIADTHHDLTSFEIRVGISTGPVVAGVVGTKKFQYDIWGDTVNTASVMESSGETGKVNISESTYQVLKDHEDFEFTYRGDVEAKGKGKIPMYFIEESTRS